MPELTPEEAFYRKLYQDVGSYYATQPYANISSGSLHLQNLMTLKGAIARRDRHIASFMKYVNDINTNINCDDDNDPLAGSNYCDQGLGLPVLLI